MSKKQVKQTTMKVNLRWREWTPALGGTVKPNIKQYPYPKDNRLTFYLDEAQTACRHQPGRIVVSVVAPKRQEVFGYVAWGGDEYGYCLGLFPGSVLGDQSLAEALDFVKWLNAYQSTKGGKKAK